MLLNFGRFDLTSKILSESEAIEMMNCSDMNDIISQPPKEKIISKYAVDSMNTEAKSSTKYVDLKTYIFGLKCVSLEAEMLLQRETTEKKIQIIIDNRE